MSQQELVDALEKLEIGPQEDEGEEKQDYAANSNVVGDQQNRALSLTRNLKQRRDGFLAFQ